MKFHEFLKILRSSREIGLREFAHSIGMDVGNYSKLERGLLSPPQKTELFEKLAKRLDLSRDEKSKLIDMASLANGRIPEDVAEEVKSSEYLPVLLRTIANKQLTDDQIRELTDRINKKY